jgi:flavin-dependent dehydrogenase
MSEPRTIEIIGGGLAGLSLGAALARAGIPTTVVEAGGYPRHRVCGEFIAGLDAKTIETLGLSPLLADARRHSSIEWFRAGRASGSQRLPAPALGISRYRLDQRLADAFQNAGGVLRTNTRVDESDQREGRVFTGGRQPRRSEWVGIKMHVRKLRLFGDLELHLGRSNYVGLCGVEDGAVNVCGLFHRSQATGGGGPELLMRALQRGGLTALAERIRGADPDNASLVTVAGLSFDRDQPEDGRLKLGDASRAIPPFTGHGMTLAFQSAAAALQCAHQQLRTSAARRL